MSCRLEPAWVEFGDQYMARVAWFPDGSVGIQVESRDQLKLQLIRFDPRTGKSTVLLEETSDVWLNLHHLLRVTQAPISGTPADPPPGSFSFVWGSERSGFMHLYLYTFLGGGDQASLVSP